MSVSENILRAESAAYDDFLYAWVAALQAYFTGELSEVEGKLLETVRLLAPESVSDRSHPDRLNEIVRPQLLLFLALLSKDADGFNKALEESLVAHRSFWTRGRDAKTSPQGYIALGPLAFACIAHDRGIPIPVESPYLPEHLVKGSWITEFEF